MIQSVYKIPVRMNSVRDADEGSHLIMMEREPALTEFHYRALPSEDVLGLYCVGLRAFPQRLSKSRKQAEKAAGPGLDLLGGEETSMQI